LLKALRSAPLEADVDFIPARTRPRKWHRLAQARSLLGSLLCDLPSKAIFLKSRQFQQNIQTHLRGTTYDLAVLNGSDLLWASDLLPSSLPRIVVAHNIEHRLFRYQIDNLGSLAGPLRKMLLRDCGQLEDFEWRGIREAGNAIFLSMDEAAHARTFCADVQSLVVPPLFDYQPRERSPRDTSSVLNVGLMANFKWWPNQLGLRWFVDEVLPFVKTPIQVHLFGAGAQGHGFRDRRIVLHGMVESREKIWAMCDFMICPAVASGGVSVKFAEAAYNGIPVLATREAARGLNLDPDPALAFLDQASDWADLLNSPAAKDLGRRHVSAKIACAFAVDTQKEALQQFIRAAISMQTVSVSQ
jgi:hypothetical protein